jgi:metallo-beta-lactamase class B
MLRRASCFLVVLTGCAAGRQPRPAPSPESTHLEAASAQVAEPARSCAPGADWHDPRSGPPQRIYGNTWYVGTCGLTALLVTSPAGHVLLDATSEEAAPQIEANIRALGFRVDDVRYILTSHAHNDHAGGLAKLKADSGAVVVSRGADAEAIERGHGDRRDPQYVSTEKFPPVAGVRRVGDGETLRVGELAVTAHATPGHTPGSTSWTWDSCEASACRHVAYVDSVSAIADDVYRYGDEAAHPGVVATFQASLSKIAVLPCDVLLTPHPDASDMWLRLGTQPSQPLVDDKACRRYAAGGRERLDARLAKEGAAAP